jgi:hypothetical protein
LNFRRQSLKIVNNRRKHKRANRSNSSKIQIETEKSPVQKALRPATIARLRDFAGFRSAVIARWHVFLSP